MLVLLVPSHAVAHASLIGSDPAQGGRLASSPKEVTLKFDEPVTLIRFQVLDSVGGEVGNPGEARMEGRNLVLPLSRSLGDGAYVIAFRVVSEDTHPVSGAITFYVGNAVAALPPAPTGERMRGLFWHNIVGANRWALYTFMLLAVGSALFRLLMSVPPEVAAAAARVGKTGAVLGAMSYVLGIAFGGAEMLTGGLSLLVGSATWTTGARSTLGVSAMLGIPAMILLLVGLPAANRSVLALGAVLAVSSFLVTGHAATASPVWLMAFMVAVHLACAAFWMGSLYPLLRATRLTAVTEAGAIMVQFSNRAVFAVLGLVVSGMVISWVQLEHFDAFVTTQYGWRLLVKLSLFSLLLTLAAYNKLVLTPRLTAADGAASQRLRRVIRIEYTLYVFILGAAASLTLTPPPRVIAARPEAIASAKTFKATAQAGVYQAQVEVAPAAAGENMVMVTVTDGSGQPVKLEDMSLTLALSSAGIANAQIAGSPAGTGWHFTVTQTIISGEWDMTVSAFITAFNEVDFNLKVPIK